jgi:hypothetical protein
VTALRIPVGDFDRITRTKFDLDNIWKYEAVRYDKNRVFLTEKYADLEHLTSNSRASDWVLNHSDAAKDPDGRMASPKRLYGPVIVVSYDWILEWITNSTRQINELKRALHWIDPLGPTD